MALTVTTTANLYTGDNSTTDFTLSPPYQEQAEILVYLDAVLQTIDTHYTLPSPSVVRFNTAPGTGVEIELVRCTSDDQKVNFTPGSVLDDATLNKAYRQLLYMVQELRSDLDRSLKLGRDKAAHVSTLTGLVGDVYVSGSNIVKDTFDLQSTVSIDANGEFSQVFAKINTATATTIIEGTPCG